jgi:hypothetical protein
MPVDLSTAVEPYKRLRKAVWWFFSFILLRSPSNRSRTADSSEIELKTRSISSKLTNFTNIELKIRSINVPHTLEQVLPKTADQCPYSNVSTVSISNNFVCRRFHWMKESDDSFVSGIKDNGKKWRYVLYFCLTD